MSTLLYPPPPLFNQYSVTPSAWTLPPPPDYLQQQRVNVDQPFRQTESRLGRPVGFNEPRHQNVPQPRRMGINGSQRQTFANYPRQSTSNGPHPQRQTVDSNPYNPQRSYDAPYQSRETNRPYYGHKATNYVSRQPSVTTLQSNHVPVQTPIMQPQVAYGVQHSTPPYPLFYPPPESYVNSASSSRTMSPAQPREPKIITIQDPETLDVVTDKLLDQARATQLKSRAASSGNRVAAEFAVKVAQVAITCPQSTAGKPQGHDDKTKTGGDKYSKQSDTKEPEPNAEEIRAEFARAVAAVAVFSGTKKQKKNVPNVHAPEFVPSSVAATTLPQPDYSSDVTRYAPYCQPQGDGIYFQPLNPYIQIPMTTTILTVATPVLTLGESHVKESKAAVIQHPETSQVLDGIPPAGDSSLEDQMVEPLPKLIDSEDTPGEEIIQDLSVDMTSGQEGKQEMTDSSVHIEHNTIASSKENATSSEERFGTNVQTSSEEPNLPLSEDSKELLVVESSSAKDEKPAINVMQENDFQTESLDLSLSETSDELAGNAECQTPEDSLREVGKHEVHPGNKEETSGQDIAPEDTTGSRPLEEIPNKVVIQTLEEEGGNEPEVKVALSELDGIVENDNLEATLEHEVPSETPVPKVESLPQREVEKVPSKSETDGDKNLSKLETFEKFKDVDFTPYFMVDRLTSGVVTQRMEVKDGQRMSGRSSPEMKDAKNAEPDPQPSKKCYSRDFLLNLQSCPASQQAPECLQRIEISLLRSSPNASTYDLPRAGPRFSQYEVRPKKIIISTSLRQEISLHKSENAWRPNKSEAQDEDAVQEELEKKVRGILNKLTPENFDKLIVQVRDLGIDNEVKLRAVIDLVFEKAISEPSFSVQYARMCQHLAGMQVSGQAQKGKALTFRKVLLTKCQNEFEKDKRDEMKHEERMKEIKNAETVELKKQLKEKLEEDERGQRRRSLGNIRFIGELFKLDMLLETIMFECLDILLHKKDEDSLECLCWMLNTVGKKLEDVLLPQKKKKKKEVKFSLDAYFKDLKKIVDKKNTSSRIRFMLQDVLELRLRKWVPRRDQSNPKTIEEIHQEAEKEAKEQAVMQHVVPQRRVVDVDRGTRISRPQGSWNEVSRRSKQPVECKRLEVPVENVKLVPVAFSSWSSGCRGGTKGQMEGRLGSRSKLAEDTVSVRNRFHALGREDERTSEKAAVYEGMLHRPLENDALSYDKSSGDGRETLLKLVKEFTKSSLDTKQKEISIPTKDVVLQGMDLPEEEVERRTKPLVDEFLSNGDFREATRCVIELASASTVHLFITAAVNQVLERSMKSREMLGQLLADFLKNNVITFGHYKKGLQAVLELGDEYAIDIPKIWTYLGEVIEPIVEDSTSISYLKSLSEPLIASRTSGKLVSEILNVVVKKRGTVRASNIWSAGGVSWSELLHPSVDVDEFIEEHGLQFTAKQDRPEVCLPMSEICHQLDTLLQRKVPDVDIVEWVETNIGADRQKDPQFVRTLVTAVVEHATNKSEPSATLDENRLKKYTGLLQRYLDQKPELELVALYAVQSLMNRLNHPRGLLKHIFDELYEEDLVSEETFGLWEESVDPAEQEGKGVALSSVHSFFVWLREDESDV